MDSFRRYDKKHGMSRKYKRAEKRIDIEEESAKVRETGGAGRHIDRQAARQRVEMVEPAQ